MKRREFLPLASSLVASVRQARPAAPQEPLERVTTGSVKDHWSGIAVHVCHFGYHPDHPKHVVADDGSAASFAVVDAKSGETVFRGELTPRRDDFGEVAAGDFSALRRTGEYYVTVGPNRSFGTFPIREHVWDEFHRMIALEYFAVRRIGEDNVVGNQGDFHGVRWDDALLPNGAGWRYMGRAFADGNDRRIYPSVSLVVAQFCRLAQTKPFWDQADWVYSQVRWGLDGALAFLDRDGILRLQLASYPDHDTDGEFQSGDEKLLVDAFDQVSVTNEYGVVNREVVYASLLIGLAEAVYTYRERDPEFFARVLALSRCGHQKLQQLFQPRREWGYTPGGQEANPFDGKYSCAAWVWLNAVLHAVTGDDAYEKLAVRYARELMSLQQTEPLGGNGVSLSGWYRKDRSSPNNPWGEKPEQEVMITPWIYQCLFRMLELFPRHEDAPRWRESIRRYARDYLLAGSRLNVYGCTPAKVGSAGLKRRRASLSYQYFCTIGRMFHQAGNAAYLMSAGNLLGDEELRRAGWKQMQWFAGFNPMGVGLIQGLSRNTPSMQHDPDTRGRTVAGGSVNGMSGDEADRPTLKYFEYYTYANLSGLWFATAAGASRFERPLLIWPRQCQEPAHAPADPQHRLITFPVRLKGGFSYRFGAIAHDRGGKVRWLVNGREGGGEQSGTITSEGVYTAPFVTETREIAIRAEAPGGAGVFDETKATVLPAPRKVSGVRVKRRRFDLKVEWEAAGENCSGYTVWRRLPVGKLEVGTIFERIGVTGPETTTYLCAAYCPAGTEFLVRAYHRDANTIFGYGPESGRAMVT